MGKIANGHPTNLNAADFGLLGLAVPADGVYHELGRYTVPDAIAIAIGDGDYSAQDTAIGRIYADLQDATAAPINGQLRLEVHNAQDRPQTTLLEGRTESYRTSATDPRQQRPLPVKRSWTLSPKWALVLMFKADAACTPSAANTTLLLSATEFDYSY